MSTADQLSTKQKKQATELPHELLVNFCFNSFNFIVTHSIVTMKTNKGDTPIQNDVTQFNCT